MKMMGLVHKVTFLGMLLLDLFSLILLSVVQSQLGNLFSSLPNGRPTCNFVHCCVCV